MQGKSFVRFFTIALMLVVSYQFLLMIPSMRIERAANNYAAAKVLNIENADEKLEQQDLAQQFFLDSLSDESVLNLGFKSYTYQELKRQQLSLGLDLKGGMSVVLQVDLRDLIYTLAKESTDPEFLKALENAKKAQANAQTDFVSLFGKEYKAISSKPLARFFIASDKLSGVDVNSTDAQVLDAIREEASQTVERTYNLLKQRIDKFGVAQPTVSLDKSTDRITVELPGVRSPKRARQFLQATASLEFWELYTASELLANERSALVALNNVLKKNPAFNGKSATDTASTAVSTPTIDSASIEADTTTSRQQKDSIYQVLSDSFSKMASADTDSTDIGPLFTSLGWFPPKDETDPFIGIAKASDTALVMNMLRSEDARRVLPNDIRFAWDAKAQKGQNGERIFQMYALRTRGKKQAPVQGERITSAFPTGNPNGIGYAVSIDMDNEGARAWKKMTEDNVKRCVAVVLDERVYSAPRVNEVIPNGRTQISGNFSATEATDLANILSIGKLPARTEIIEEAVVGPSLGQATVNAGLFALILGFVFVLCFMLFYYGMAGILSVVALFINIFFILGTLASFGTVLTLPGIAGIVLTIGMAVDANVIIFERIREELRKGLAWKEAVNQGFGHSYSAIIDANVTTFVTALILFMYGLGPIKGFATVLMIGVVCSVFTAVLIGRLLFERFIVKNKEVTVGNKTTQNVLAEPKVDFMARRKTAYIVSGILIIASIASMFVRGFELGVDFQGGRSYTVEFPQAVKVGDLKAKLSAAFDGDNKTIIKTFNEANQVKITTSFMQTSTDENADAIVLGKLLKGCNEYASTTVADSVFAAGKPSGSKEAGLYLSASSKIGPTIADDIRQSSFLASILALLFIFTYIFIRFRKWQFSLGAVAALFHDVTILLGVFSLMHGILPFSLEVDQAFIAAVLTVIGYSINDTVIVFDRIREEATNTPDDSLKGVVNRAINNTLSRTSITSFTTFLVIVILLAFGGDGIRGFAFALFVGIIVGTYSSIFIASPVIVDTTRDASALQFKEEDDNEPELVETDEEPDFGDDKIK